MATSGHPKILLNNVTANGSGMRQHCAVNFGQGEVAQACTNFVVDVSTTGSPTGFTITLTGGVNEQGAGLSTIFSTTVTQVGPHLVTSSVPITWWQATLSALTGGTSPTVRAVGISAS